MSNEERKQELAVTQSNDADERKNRMRQIANVWIEMFLEQRDRIAELPAQLAEAA